MLGPEQGRIMERLAQEHDNMRAALAWGRENAQGYPVALKLAAWLWRFWMQRGYWKEGREHLESLLDAPTSYTDCESRGRALNGLGILAYRMGDFDTARARLEASRTLFQSREDARGVAAAISNLGHIASAQGNLEEARALYEEGLTFLRATGNESGIAYSLLNLGNVAATKGDITEGINYYTEALALFRRIGDSGGELLTLGNLGNCILLQNDAPHAIIYLRQALALCRDLKRPEAEGLYLPILGGAFEKQGDTARAWECYRQAIQVAQKLGDKRALTAAMETLAAHYLNIGQDEKAARYYGGADAGYTRIALCRLENEQQNREKAFDCLRSRMGEAAFDACFATGQRCSLEELVQEALAE